MVQIDGLSHAMLARAMAEGALPFLEWLVRRHGFALHRYDLYVVSDHGQVAGVSCRDLAEGTAFERRLFGEHSAYERDGVRVISAGPNALLCVVDTPGPPTIEQIEPRFPGLSEAISRSPGIGFVLTPSQHGPVCFWRGRRAPLGSGESGPFRDRRDVALVIEGIMDLMAMPSAGDLVIYGIDAPQGHVSSIPEAGAHAGPSPEELHTVLVAPPAVRVPGPITHPVQLYAPFVAYQEQA